MSSGSKYLLKSSITYDYCETFEWTSDLIRKMKVDVAENDGSYYRENNMKCFSSALTILEVTEADLGEYKCVLNAKYDNYQESENTQTIRVYNAASPEQMPKKIEYFQRFYTKGIKSKLLMQCVVTGGPVHWFIRLATDDCGRWIDDRNDCVNQTIRPIEDVKELKGWRCFNETSEHHNPYNLNQITESFIYFQNICMLDWAGIYCSADPNGNVRSEVASLTLKDEWDDYYYWDYWYIDDTVRILGYVMLPIVLSVFFLTGVIIACYRGEICNCCGGHNMSYRYQAVQPNPPQVFHYAVPPQSNLAQPQFNFAQPQVNLAQPQVSLAQPQVNLAQPQVSLAQPQVSLAQPQVNLAQPQVSLAQPQVNLAQPQVNLAQPQVNNSQGYVNPSPEMLIQQ